jgi:hypothetical protein
LSIIENYDADMGGTELLNPLKVILNQKIPPGYSK